MAGVNELPRTGNIQFLDVDHPPEIADPQKKLKLKDHYGPEGALVPPIIETGSASINASETARVLAHLQAKIGAIDTLAVPSDHDISQTVRHVAPETVHPDTVVSQIDFQLSRPIALGRRRGTEKTPSAAVLESSTANVTHSEQTAKEGHAESSTHDAVVTQPEVVGEAPASITPVETLKIQDERTARISQKAEERRKARIATSNLRGGVQGLEGLGWGASPISDIGEAVKEEIEKAEHTLGASGETPQQVAAVEPVEPAKDQVVDQIVGPGSEPVEHTEDSQTEIPAPQMNEVQGIPQYTADEVLGDRTAAIVQQAANIEGLNNPAATSTPTETQVAGTQAETPVVQAEAQSENQATQKVGENQPLGDVEAQLKALQGDEGVTVPSSQTESTAGVASAPEIQLPNVVTEDDKQLQTESSILTPNMPNTAMPEAPAVPETTAGDNENASEVTAVQPRRGFLGNLTNFLLGTPPNTNE